MRVSVFFLWMFSAIGSGAAQQPILLMQRTWANNPTNGTSDCVLVKSDGSYHFEHTPFDLGQPGHHQVHVGKLSEGEMKDLQQMLDNPELRSLTTPKLGNGFRAPDYDFLSVAIDRGNDRQLLFFESAAGPTKAGAGSHLPSLSQTPAMKPLMNWYKQISKRKDDIDKTAAPECSLEIRWR